MADRVTQFATEVVRNAVARLRATQLATEVVRNAVANLRTTQLTTEVVYQAALPAPRTTQFCVEVVRSTASLADVNISIDDSITVTSAGRPSARQVPVEVATSVTVAQAQAGTSPQKRITVTSTVQVAQTQVGSTLNKTLVDAIHVASSASGRNSNIRVGVTTSIGVGVPANGHGDPNRQSVTHAANVGSLGHVFENQVGSTVLDTVTVRSSITDNKYPLEIFLKHHIFLADRIREQAPRIHVADLIQVVSQPRSGFRYAQVNETVLVGQSSIGAGGTRALSISDTATVVDTAQGHPDIVRKSVVTAVGVVTTRTPRIPYFPISLTDSVAVASTQLPIGPKALSVVDQVVVGQTPFGRKSNHPISITDTIAVSPKLRWTPVDAPVTTTIQVSPRLATFEIGVTSRIQVASFHRRNQSANLTDSPALSDGVTTRMLRDITIVELPPLADSVIRGTLINRSVSEQLIIPEGMYRKEIFLPEPIIVPVASGGLVTTYTVLQCEATAITLPAPLLSDGMDNVDTVLIHRSMNAKSLVFKTSSSRRKLQLRFRLDKAKAMELRLFLQTNLSKVITLRTYDAQVWAVQIPQAPFEIQNAGRGGNADEFATVELVMEGEKLSG